MFVLNIGRFSSQYVNGMNEWLTVKLAEKIFPFSILFGTCMSYKLKRNHLSKNAYSKTQQKRELNNRFEIKT